MPWVDQGWTSSDVAFWADSGDYTKQDRHEVRPAVGVTSLYLEYLIDDIGRNYFTDIMQHIRVAN